MYWTAGYPAGSILIWLHNVSLLLCPCPAYIFSTIAGVHKLISSNSLKPLCRLLPPRCQVTVPVSQSLGLLGRQALASAALTPPGYFALAPPPRPIPSRLSAFSPPLIGLSHLLPSLLLPPVRPIQDPTGLGPWLLSSRHQFTWLF